MSEETKQESELQIELRAAIEKHLPSETSGILRERLDTLAKIEVQFAELKSDYALSLTDRQNLVSAQAKGMIQVEELLKHEDSVKTREAALTVRELDCAYREQVIQLKEQHATERVAEMRDVVKDVFGNNRFKYEKTSQVPVAVEGMVPGHADGSGYATPGMCGHVQTHEQTETIQGEGDAPSA